MNLSLFTLNYMSKHCVNGVTSAYCSQEMDDICVQFSSQHAICQNTTA